MSKFHAIIHTPFLPVLAVVSLLAFGWETYTSAAPQLNHPTMNILPNGGLNTIDAHGMPTGWQFSPADTGSNVRIGTGNQSPHQLTVANHGNASASTTVTSPEAPVATGTRYLYKGFYRATMPFELVMKSTRSDGSVRYETVQQYDPSQEWTTVSYLFDAPPDIRTVAFVYRTNAHGELSLDNTYLEPNPQHVTPPAAMRTGTNLLPALNDTSDQAWDVAASGNLHVAEANLVNSSTPSLHLRVDAYQSGDAGWESATLPAHGNQAFELRAGYTSSAPADIIADYTLASGRHVFNTLATVMPTADWTYVSHDLETPHDAVGVAVSFKLRSAGTLDTREYSLIDISKAGTPAWSRPLVSITFDDGWESSFKNGVPLLAKYGYAATFYLTPSALDTENFMTSQNVDALVAAGHEIASHGYQHLDFTTLAPEAVDDQLSHAAAYFHQVRKLDAIQFSTPFGTSDNEVTYAAEKYYSSLRTTDDGINTRQNFDPYHLLVLYIGNDTPANKLAEALADAQALNGWLIVVYHRVDTNTKGEPVIAPAQFQTQLDVIKRSHITVMPVGAALHEITKQKGT